MLVMEMEEVLVARIVCFGQIFANLLKISNLSLGISGTASMTKSTDEKSSILVLVLSNDRAWSACSCVILDLDTSLASSFSIIHVSCSLTVPYPLSKSTRALRHLPHQLYRTQLQQAWFDRFPTPTCDVSYFGRTVE